MVTMVLIMLMMTMTVIVMIVVINDNHENKIMNCLKNSSIIHLHSTKRILDAKNMPGHRPSGNETPPKASRSILQSNRVSQIVIHRKTLLSLEKYQLWMNLEVPSFQHIFNFTKRQLWKKLPHLFSRKKHDSFTKISNSTSKTEFENWFHIEKHDSFVYSLVIGLAGGEAYPLVNVYIAIENPPIFKFCKSTMSVGHFPVRYLTFAQVNLHFPMLFLSFSYGFPMVKPIGLMTDWMTFGARWAHPSPVKTWRWY